MEKQRPIDRIQDAVQSGKLDEWKCGNCGYLLGVIVKRGDCQVMQIKIKDRYIWFQDGTIETVCRGCSTMCRFSFVDLEKEELGEVKT